VCQSRVTFCFNVQLKNFPASSAFISAIITVKCFYGVARSRSKINFSAHSLAEKKFDFVEKSVTTRKRCLVLAYLVYDCPDRAGAAALILDRAKVDARRSEGIPVRILFNRARHRRGQIAASPRNAIIIHVGNPTELLRAVCASDSELLVVKTQ